jgi:hypothetical protein
LQLRPGERRCPRWGSNPHWDPFKGPASAGWATGAEEASVGTAARCLDAASIVVPVRSACDRQPTACRTADHPQWTCRNGDHRHASDDAVDERVTAGARQSVLRRARRRQRRSPAPAAARTALDLATAVAPAAHPPAVAGVAAVCDPLPEGAGAAATEAATVTVACRAGLHVLDHLPARLGSCDRSHTV